MSNVHGEENYGWAKLKGSHIERKTQNQSQNPSVLYPYANLVSNLYPFFLAAIFSVAYTAENSCIFGFLRNV